MSRSGREPEFGRQNGRCGNHRPCQRSASCFINSGNQRNACRPEMLLKSKAAPHVRRKSSILRFFFHRHGLLAFAIPKVIELGTAHAPGSLDFDLGNARGVERENTFNAFSVGDATNRKCRVEPGPTPANHNTRKNLNPLFVALHDSGVNSDRVADLETTKYSALTALAQSSE